MLIVPEKEISGLMTREAAFDAVENVFASMASGKAYNFPVIRESLVHENALYGFKGGFDRKGGALGLKAGGYWPENLEKRGLINHQSTIFLFDPDTGRTKAAVGGNLLTALRTSAASAVSIKHLAPEDAKVIGMIGAGHQAKFQLQGALEQRNFEKVIGWNRNKEALSSLKAVADEAGVAFEQASLDDMKQADVIISITSSFDAILLTKNVSLGTHIACMGTDTKGKQEVETSLFAKSLVFTDEVAQSISIGEAQHPVAQNTISKSDIVQIGEVINGAHKGRTEPSQITIFDGTGVGLQDLAVANAVVDLAVSKGIAIEVEI